VLGILTWTYRRRLRSRHREVKALESSALAVIQEVLTIVSGCAGAFVFSWTDQWHRGGHEIEDWDFGLTTRDRGPKLALGAVSQAFDRKPVQDQKRRPRVSDAPVISAGRRWWSPRVRPT